MDAHGYAVLSNNKKIGGVLGRDFLLSEAGNAVSVPAQRLDAAFWAIFLFFSSFLFIYYYYLFFFWKRREDVRLEVPDYSAEASDHIYTQAVISEEERSDPCSW